MDEYDDNSGVGQGPHRSPSGRNRGAKGGKISTREGGSATDKREGKRERSKTTTEVCIQGRTRRMRPQSQTSQRE